MKKAVLFIIVIFVFLKLSAQDNPYAIFGYETKTNFEVSDAEKFHIENTDENSNVKTLIFDFENKQVHFLDACNDIINTLVIEDDKLLRWLSCDPLAAKYPGWTPYKFALNNPMYYIDPTGLSEDTYYMDEKGNQLFHSTDNLPNSVVVVKNDKVKEFNAVIDILKTQGKGVENGDAANKVMKNMYAKEIYDIPAIEEFFEANKTDIHRLENGSQNPAGFINEHGTYLYNNNGIIAPGVENIQGTTTITIFDQDPSSKSKGTLAGRMHTHANSGQVTDRGTFEDRPSDTDFQNAPMPGQGFHVVVSAYNVYVHNRSNMLKVPR